MLASLLEKYKDHRPTLCYFRSDDHECINHGTPSGWYCSIYKIPCPHILGENHEDDLIRVGGFETSTDALLAISHML